MIYQSHEHPPSIVQLEDNILSSLSSDTSSSSSSDNLSRSLTSVILKTNSDVDDLFLSSFQSTKNCKSYSKYKMSENQHADYFLFFCNWAMGTRSENCYDKPHQKRCVGKLCGAKMLHWEHKGCKVRVHIICQIDWLKQYCLEVNYDDPIFANSTMSVTRNMFD
jgi:hypothetical protein